MSMYVNDFFLVSKTMAIFETLKKLLVMEYKIKNLREVKTIISWQIIRDTAAHTMKIN